MKTHVLVAAVCVAVALPRLADAKGCHEVSDVVGIQRCSAYGYWSRESRLPRLWVDMDFLVHRIAVAPYTLGAAPRMTLGATEHDTTTNVYGYAQSARFGLTPLFYTGFDFGWAWAPTPPEMPGPPTLHGEEFETHVLFGAHVERFRLGLSGELAFGPQLASFDDCPLSQRTCPSTMSVSQSRLDLEGRVRLDLFVHPRFSLGVAYGQSLINATEHSLTIGLGIHVRPLDGMW